METPHWDPVAGVSDWNPIAVLGRGGVTDWNAVAVLGGSLIGTP